MVLVLILVASAIPTFGQDTGMMDFEFEHYNGGSAVVVNGEAGEWDSAVAFSPILVEYEEMYYMFYSGTASTIDVSGTSIGLATSTDGLMWTKYDQNPIFQHNGDTRTSVAVVTVVDGEWIMIYSVPSSTGGPDRNLYRATAPSAEGPWVNDVDPVLVGQSGRWDRNMWPQSLVYTDDEYRLYYIGFNQFLQFPQIGLATSPDGINWERYDDPETTDAEYDGTDPIIGLGEDEETWDFMGVTNSNILQTEDGWEMFYVGYDRIMFTASTGGYEPLQLGYATSADGVTWTKHNEPVIDTGEVAAPLMNMVKIEETYYIYYDIEFGGKGIGLITGKINQE